ncbi:hypothetical protein KSP40_PGU004015 [Platanthera guangdongensis]|uniref:Malectin-like domain-containing protein n=1 Tax=Platanthera guangdongensis TaxID=2320717 RepID=A0ABR2MDA6_9ASPA
MEWLRSMLGHVEHAGACGARARTPLLICNDEEICDNVYSTFPSGSGRKDLSSQDEGNDAYKWQSLYVMRHMVPILKSCTTYFYVGVNVPDNPPVFDQIVNGTFWIIVNTATDYVAGAASRYNGIFLARGTKMRICLARIDYTNFDPFMNTLEMIVLEDYVYNSADFRKKALVLIVRSRFGYDGAIVRYGFPIMFFEFY